MFFVDLRLPPHDLPAQMGDMRIWLDRHEVETSEFLVKGAMARLAFRVKPQAEAFAVRFADRMIPRPADPGQANHSATAGRRYPCDRTIGRAMAA
jgi:hypothetical protein